MEIFKFETDSVASLGSWDYPVMHLHHWESTVNRGEVDKLPSCIHHGGSLVDSPVMHVLGNHFEFFSKFQQLAITLKATGDHIPGSQSQIRLSLLKWEKNILTVLKNLIRD